MRKRRSLPPGFNPDAWLARREFWRVSAHRPPPPFKIPEAVGKAAERIFRSCGLPVEDALAARIEEVWPGVVGPDGARRSRPGAVENGVLTVLAASSAWFAELRRTAHSALLPKLRDALRRGDEGGPCGVSSIRVKLDPGAFEW